MLGFKALRIALLVCVLLSLAVVGGSQGWTGGIGTAAPQSGPATTFPATPCPDVNTCRSKRYETFINTPAVLSTPTVEMPAQTQVPTLLE
jgi:hypothetical protein